MRHRNACNYWKHTLKKGGTSEYKALKYSQKTYTSRSEKKEDKMTGTPCAIARGSCFTILDTASAHPNMGSATTAHSNGIPSKTT